MARNSITIVTLLCVFITLVSTAPPNQPAQIQPRYQVVSEKFHQEPNLEYAFE